MIYKKYILSVMVFTCPCGSTLKKSYPSYIKRHENSKKHKKYLLTVVEEKTSVIDDNSWGIVKSFMIPKLDKLDLCCFCGTGGCSVGKTDRKMISSNFYSYRLVSICRDCELNKKKVKYCKELKVYINMRRPRPISFRLCVELGVNQPNRGDIIWWNRFYFGGNDFSFKSFGVETKQEIITLLGDYFRYTIPNWKRTRKDRIWEIIDNREYQRHRIDYD